MNILQILQSVLEFLRLALGYICLAYLLSVLALLLLCAIREVVEAIIGAIRRLVRRIRRLPEPVKPIEAKLREVDDVYVREVMVHHIAKNAGDVPVRDDEIDILDRVMELLQRMGRWSEGLQKLILNDILREVEGANTDRVPSLEEARGLLVRNRRVMYETYGVLLRYLGDA